MTFFTKSKAMFDMFLDRGILAFKNVELKMIVRPHPSAGSPAGPVGAARDRPAGRW
ncbi:hypothetical protein [Pseudactinotalea sp. HY160]|uniref:hypothetical protein n=1 Tax=Pseudactinotalea sp. HY160 TaxID=2654490 RepID=UPI001884045D|nr:hypothetical protein [Pseudactinotalea sp. HY160]